MEQKNYRITKLQSGDIILNIAGDFRKARKIGTIQNDTLHCIKNERHVLRINNGLGIAYDLLRDYNFKYIEINYLGKILRTTKEFFLNNSVFFQFGNYEKQKFLPLEKFGLDKTEIKKPVDVQLNMFGAVAN